MGRNVFLVSDTHWGHKKMYEQPFLREDGTPVRPWGSAEEADVAMVERWNQAVRPCDLVYHLGDVAFTSDGLALLDQLNGDKVLVAGNHDRDDLLQYAPYFKKISAHRKLDDFVLSHVPIHPGSLLAFKGNLHGHLHHRQVLDDSGLPDPRYLCVCVEHTDYAPIPLEEARKRFEARRA